MNLLVCLSLLLSLLGCGNPGRISEKAGTVKLLDKDAPRPGNECVKIGDIDSFLQNDDRETALNLLLYDASLKGANYASHDGTLLEHSGHVHYFGTGYRCPEGL